MNVVIDGRRIGPGERPYIVAEMSGNHNGDLARALALIDAAKDAGADAVKIQTYTADTITIDHDGPGFRLEGGLWAGRTLHELYEEAHTPWDWHKAMFDHARAIGITLFSSPFDPSAVDFLESLGAPAYKIASFELVDLPLIRYAARKGKPMIVSTGMANLAEIDEAVRAIQQEGNDQIVLLHCTSGYPTPIEESDIATLPHLAKTFGVPAGLSDHSEGATVPLIAVALGAVLIEKHFTLNRADGGVDSAFSLNKEELADLVRQCRLGFQALGTANYDSKPSEGGGRDFRRSLYVTTDITEGAALTAENIRSIRPGGGLHPRFLPDVLGKTARRSLNKGEPLDWTMIA